MALIRTYLTAGTPVSPDTVVQSLLQQIDLYGFIGILETLRELFATGLDGFFAFTRTRFAHENASPVRTRGRLRSMCEKRSESSGIRRRGQRLTFTVTEAELSLGSASELADTTAVSIRVSGATSWVDTPTRNRNIQKVLVVDVI